MKRFYKLVSTQKSQGGYTVELDGKPVKTPLKSTLLAPNEAIAHELVREWAGQGDDIIPDSMPLTQILSTQIDKVERERDRLQAPLLKYLDTDLICYRTDKPEELRRAQEEAWNPAIDWFEKKFSAPLKITTGLSALQQSPQAHKAAQDYVQSLPNEHFTILQLVAPISGSVVLGCAFVEGQISAEQLFKAIRVEENFKAAIYNEDFYGQDPAQEAKDKAIQRDLEAAQTYLSLL